MPTPEEMARSQQLARIPGLEEENERLKEKVKRLNEDREPFKKENAELNQVVGAAGARATIAEQAAEKNAGILERERALHKTEVAAAQALLREKDVLAVELKSSADQAGALLKQNQLILLGRTWAPWVSVALVASIIVAFLFFVRSGIVIPSTGDQKADTNSALNQLMQREQRRYELDLENQKPHTVWGSQKVMTTDDEIIISVNLHLEEKVREEKKPQVEFVSSVILSALKMNVRRGMRPDGSLYLVVPGPAMRNDYFDNVLYLNTVLGESGCKLISERFPIFSFNLQVEYLHPNKEDFRKQSFFLEFKDGKFIQNTQKGV